MTSTVAVSEPGAGWPRGMPSLTSPQLDVVEVLWPAAVGIALMSSTESIAAGRAFADPQEPRPVPNGGLFALGAANAAGGLLGATLGGDRLFLNLHSAVERYQHRSES